MVFELRGKLLFYASLGGGISWGFYKILLTYFSHYHYLLPFFLATVIASLYAEVMARLIRKPATIFQLVAMLPLVPGEGIYLTMFYLVQGETERGLTKGGETLAIAGALALGILFVSSLAKLYVRPAPKSMVSQK